MAQRGASGPQATFWPMLDVPRCPSSCLATGPTSLCTCPVVQVLGVSLLGAWHGPWALDWHPHGMATRPEASSRPPELLPNPGTAGQEASGSPLQAELRLGTRSVRSGRLPLHHFSVALVVRTIPRGSPLGVQMQSRHRPEWALCHVPSSLPASCLLPPASATVRGVLDPGSTLIPVSTFQTSPSSFYQKGFPLFQGTGTVLGHIFFYTTCKFLCSDFQALLFRNKRKHVQI